PHPALLDIAASLPLDKARLPIGCETIYLTGRAMPPEVLVHAVRQSADEQGLTARVTLLDPASGTVLARLDGLRFSPAVNALEEAPALAVPAWVDEPPDSPADLLPTAVVGEGPMADSV